MPSYTNGLSSKIIRPSPGPEWLIPPYRFAGTVTLSAGFNNSVYVPLQTISISKFILAGPEIAYGSGSTGNGSDNVAGLTYVSGVWTVYTYQGYDTNTKSIANSITTPAKAVGATDGWSAGSLIPAAPIQLYINPAY
jgi:hypothetical protein